MSKASNLAGFVTSISPPSDLNVGIVTATNFVSSGATINNSGIVAGVVTATSFSGDGSGLSNVGGLGTDISINTTGIITATGGFGIGISSAGTSITTGPITTLNFVGSGNTFAVNGTTVDISTGGGGGGGVPADILVVGGGGGGGPSVYPLPSPPGIRFGGGGGAGGVVYATNYGLSPGETYTITVGGGGAASANGNDSNIVDSSSVTILNSLGGGKEGPNNRGGCGGGRTGLRYSYNSFHIIPGGKSPESYEYTDRGGHVMVNGNGIDPLSFSIPYPTPVPPTLRFTVGATAGAGAGAFGAAYTSTITGSPVSYSAGGAKGRYLPSPPTGGPSTPQTPAAANTGNGGDGAEVRRAPPSPNPVGSASGGDGGSGIVIIKWPTAYPAAPSYPGATVIPSPTHHIYQFTSSGTITLD